MTDVELDEPVEEGRGAEVEMDGLEPTLVVPLLDEVDVPPVLTPMEHTGTGAARAAPAYARAETAATMCESEKSIV